MGALIDKNTLEGGEGVAGLFETGRLLEGGR